MTNKIDLMCEKAKQAQAQAYSPYSGCEVGVCIKTTDDTYFSGCNVENASYAVTACAEVSAVTAMITAGKYDITDVMITSNKGHGFPPWGKCRQLLSEFAAPDMTIHFTDSDGQFVSLPFSDIFPHAFQPKHVGDTE